MRSGNYLELQFDVRQVVADTCSVNLELGLFHFEDGDGNDYSITPTSCSLSVIDLDIARQTFYLPESRRPDFEAVCRHGDCLNPSV